MGPGGRAASSSIDPQLRNARSGDSVAVAGLLGELGYPTSAGQAAERIATIEGDPATHLIVAEVEGDVAGFVALHVQNLVERDEPGCEVAGLVVGKRFRRQGIGEALMEAVESEARRRGGTHLVLNTAHRRADAHAFYEALGYEHTGRRYMKEL
ncbi:MAG TPA: GNAT family N-acetyltransferase [Gaiellaceae bacterium]|nr:GNAT family N-acetyltransferase [Gaiellaceae bacterium]